MPSKNLLFTNTDDIFKEGVNDTKKPNLMKEAINPPIAKNNVDTVNKKDKT